MCCVCKGSRKEYKSPTHTSRPAFFLQLNKNLASTKNDQSSPMHIITQTTSTQLEALQCNETNTHKLVENLMVMVLNLTEDVKILCKDNCYKLFLKLYNHELMTRYEKYDQQVHIQICKLHISEPCIMIYM